MNIIRSGVTRKTATPVYSRMRPTEEEQISAEATTATATALLALIASSCDELGEKLSLAISRKQFSGYEEQTAKLVADLFSVSLSAERLSEDINPVPETDGGKV